MPSMRRIGRLALVLALPDLSVSLTESRRTPEIDALVAELDGNGDALAPRIDAASRA